MIVGIAGEAENGKDTIGEIIDSLWSEKNYKGTRKNGSMRASFYNEFEMVKFADGINRTIHAITGLPMDYIMNKDKYDLPIAWLDGKTLRDLKQILGEGIKSLLGEDIWIKSSFTRKPITANVKVTDIRFHLELDFLYKRKDAILFFVHRPNHVAKTLSEDNKKAISEMQVRELDKSKFTYVISNDGSVADLRAKIKTLLKDNEIWNRATEDPM